MGLIDSIGGFLGARDERQGIDDAKRDYRSNMKDVMEKFMEPWTGKAAAGYETEKEYFYGGEKTINLRSKMSKREWKEFKQLPTAKEQSDFLSETLGYPVTVSEAWSKGMSKKDRKEFEVTVTPGVTTPEEGYGTFESLDEIRKKGGTPSVEAEYAPWIKPGQDAYQMLTAAIVGGDMSGFKEDPGTEYLRQEMRREADRLASANRLPTSSVHQALIEKSGNLADQTYGNYLQRLSNLAQFGYNAFTDKQSEQYGYKSGEASLGASKAAGTASLGMQQAQAQGIQTQAGVNLLGDMATTGLDIYQNGLKQAATNIFQSGYTK